MAGAGLSLFILLTATFNLGPLCADEDIRIQEHPYAHLAPTPDKFNRGFNQGQPLTAPPDITRGDMGRMQISVTFDGGFESAEAEAILDTLYARGIKTTVFLTGLFIERHPDVARRIVRDGHEVGNHTMTHPHLTEYTRSFRQKKLPSIDRAFIARELKEAERLFRKTTGAEMARFWRAPYGEMNAEIRLWAYEAGYLHVGWTSDWKTRESLDSLDWVSDRASRLYRTPGEIKDRILNFNRETHGVRGGIILMHLSTDRKTDRVSSSLGEILDGLMEKGYRFVKVSELIGNGTALNTAGMHKKNSGGPS